jgi:hypothetical protein
MGTINWSRVFLGGLVWWVVFNVLWIAALVVYLNPEVVAAWKALGLTYSPTPGVAVFWFALTFVGGVVAIWLYAAIRPRYGPGPKTAVSVGLAFWFIGEFAPMMFFGVHGVFPWRFVLMDVATVLVVVVVATVAGAWLYREE